VLSGHGRDPAVAQVAQQLGAGVGMIRASASDVVQQCGRHDQASIQVKAAIVEPFGQAQGDVRHGLRVHHHGLRRASVTK
jgi:hypothetical protein